MRGYSSACCVCGRVFVFAYVRVLSIPLFLFLIFSGCFLSNFSRVLITLVRFYGQTYLLSSVLLSSLLLEDTCDTWPPIGSNQWLWWWGIVISILQFFSSSFLYLIMCCCFFRSTSTQDDGNHWHWAEWDH